jgi:hypothetical protein
MSSSSKSVRDSGIVIPSSARAATASSETQFILSASLKKDLISASLSFEFNVQAVVATVGVMIIF